MTDHAFIEGQTVVFNEGEYDDTQVRAVCVALATVTQTDFTALCVSVAERGTANGGERVIAEAERRGWLRRIDAVETVELGAFGFWSPL